MDFLTRIIDFSLNHRILVVLAIAILIAAGLYSLGKLEIDAFPDTTTVQVQVNTVAPALGPEEVERQITIPLESSLSGMPRLAELRSISKFGLSQIVVVFEDGVDIYFARQIVGERIRSVELSPGISPPQLGPVATGLGEVLHYIVQGQGLNPTDLRTLQDWVIKPPLKNTPGVAEINGWGGYVKQYQVLLHPDQLIKHGLTYDQVLEAIRTNNLNVGGGNISGSGNMLLVQGIGRTSDLQQIREIVIASRHGIPIHISDIAEVVIGHELRRGAVTANGRGEVVLGLGFMLMRENSHQVTQRMTEKLDRIQSSLPANVQVKTVYDRTKLVEQVIATVRQNLFEGGLFVIAVLFAFLGNIRAASMVALAIPLSMLFAFSGMYRFGIAASLLSLGAIDFGLVVDSSVVMMENCVRRLSDQHDLNFNRKEIIRNAIVEVRRPTLFGELIIMIVYVPILTLEGIEGKLFRPMALTVIFALLGSLILSMTLMPVLASSFLPKRIHHQEPLLMRAIRAIHDPLLKWSLNFRTAILGIALCILVFAFGFIAPNLGSEFVPRLSEGALALGVARIAGTDLSESIRSNSEMERLLRKNFPDEIEDVWSRIGTAEVATDPMGIEMTDIFITLTARSRWRRAHNQDDLTRQIELLFRDFPGQATGYSQPIEMRVNEMISGVRSDLGIRLFGDDFELLSKTAQDIASRVRSVPGAADVIVEQTVGQPMLQVKVRPDEIARFGLSRQQILSMVEAIGGKPMGEVIEGQLRFPLVVRLPNSERIKPDEIGRLLISTPIGEQIPLERLADIDVVQGVSTISRDWGQRRIVISANVRDRDLGSFVEQVQRELESLPLPSARYRIEYGGQFENLIRAERRLMIVVPLALVLIFSMLYVTYNNVFDAMRVFTAVPFAWVGGLFALWLRDMPFSISAGIGFVALSGIAVLDDMLLVTAVRRFRQEGKDVQQAVWLAATSRLRPVLMTSLVASLGFLPMAFSQGVGAEVQRPLATVIIGGVMSGMFMSLFVLRALYSLFSFRSSGTNHKTDNPKQSSNSL